MPENSVQNVEFSPLSALYSVKLQRRTCRDQQPVTTATTSYVDANKSTNSTRTPDLEFLFPEQDVSLKKTTQTAQKRQRSRLDTVRGRRRNMVSGRDAAARRSISRPASVCRRRESSAYMENHLGVSETHENVVPTIPPFAPFSPIRSSKSRPVMTNGSGAAPRLAQSKKSPLLSSDSIVNLNHPSLPRELREHSDDKISPKASYNLSKIASTNQLKAAAASVKRRPQINKNFLQKASLHDCESPPPYSVDNSHSDASRITPSPQSVTPLSDLHYSHQSVKSISSAGGNAANGLCTALEDSTTESLSEDVIFQRLHPPASSAITCHLQHSTNAQFSSSSVSSTTTERASATHPPTALSTSQSAQPSDDQTHIEPQAIDTEKMVWSTRQELVSASHLEEHNTLFWEKWFSLRGWPPVVGELHHTGSAELEHKKCNVTDSVLQSNCDEGLTDSLPKTISASNCVDDGCANGGAVLKNSVGLIARPESQTMPDTFSGTREGSKKFRPLFKFEARPLHPCPAPLYNSDDLSPPKAVKPGSHDAHTGARRPEKIAATMRSYLSFLKSPRGQPEDPSETPTHSPETLQFSDAILGVTRENRSNASPRSHYSQSSTAEEEESFTVSPLSSSARIPLTASGRQSCTTHDKLHPLSRRSVVMQQEEALVLKAPPSSLGENDRDKPGERTLSKTATTIGTQSTLTTSSTGPPHVEFFDHTLQRSCDFALAEGTNVQSDNAFPTSHTLSDLTCFVPEGCTPRPDLDQSIHIDDPIAAVTEEGSVIWEEPGRWSDPNVSVSSSNAVTSSCEQIHVVCSGEEDLIAGAALMSLPDSDTFGCRSQTEASKQIVAVESAAHAFYNDDIWPRVYLYPLLESITSVIRLRLRESLSMNTAVPSEPEDHCWGLSSALHYDSLIPKPASTLRHSLLVLWGWCVCCTCAAACPSWLALGYQSSTTSALDAGKVLRLAISSSVYWVFCVTSILLFFRLQSHVRLTYERRWSQRLCQHLSSCPAPLVQYIMGLPWDAFGFHLISVCYPQSLYTLTASFLVYSLFGLVAVSIGACFGMFALSFSQRLLTLEGGVWIFNLLLAASISFALLARFSKMQQSLPTTPLQSLQTVNKLLGLLELMTRTQLKPNASPTSNALITAQQHTVEQHKNVASGRPSENEKNERFNEDSSVHPSFESPCPWWWVYRDYLRFTFGGVVVKWSFCSKNFNSNDERPVQYGLLYLEHNVDKKRILALREGRRRHTVLNAAGSDRAKEPVGIRIYVAQWHSDAPWPQLSKSVALSQLTAFSVPTCSSTHARVILSGYSLQKKPTKCSSIYCRERLRHSTHLETIALSLKKDDGLALYRLIHSLL